MALPRGVERIRTARAANKTFAKQRDAHVWLARTVVATRVGAIPEVVPEGAGILVAPDDSTALADGLRRMIENLDVRQHYADGARAAARSFARWRDTAARVASALDAVE